MRESEEVALRAKRSSSGMRSVGLMFVLVVMSLFCAELVGLNKGLAVVEGESGKA